MRWLQRAAAALALAALGGLLGVTAPASAATSDIEVSDDGVHFAPAMTRNLFDNLAAIVPGGSQNDAFYIRNASTNSGVLRVILQDVVATSPAYANALQISISTASVSGGWNTISAAQPCWRMLEGDVIAPGQVVRISADVRLMSTLTGEAGQDSTASVSLVVSLSDVAAGTTPVTSCGGGPSTTVPVGPHSPAGSGHSTVVVDPAPAPAPIDPNLPTDPFPPTGPGTNATRLEPNTFLWHEEYLVFILMAAFAIGFGVYRARDSWLSGPDERDVIR